MSIVGAIMVPHPPMIIPEVGRGSEREIQTTIDAYREAARFAAELKPETVIVSTPHSVMYSDYFHISPGKSAKGSFARYRAKGVKVAVDYDEEFADSLSILCDAQDFPAGTMGERDPQLDHATMIPLLFLNEFYTNYKAVRIGLSALPFADHYKLGQFIRATADRLNRRVVYIASGDLSHVLQDYGPYGFAPEGPEYDAKIMDVMGRGDFLALLHFPESFCENAAECGHRSFIMMAGALDGCAVEAKALSHEDVTGVGYGICTYRVTGEDENRRFLDIYTAQRKSKILEMRRTEDPYVRLAREQVERYVRNRKRMTDAEIEEFVRMNVDSEDAGSDASYDSDTNSRSDISPLDSGAGQEPATVQDAAAVQDAGHGTYGGVYGELMGTRAGTFVSIHKNGALRGCIGTIESCYSSVAREICANAISASTKDPRFSEIRPDELDLLEITVDVLGPTERISSPDELDVKRYGVIVSKGRHRGLLLPNLDGVDTVEDQISIALRKAGLPDSLKGVTLERFEVVRHY